MLVDQRVNSFIPFVFATKNGQFFQPKKTAILVAERLRIRPSARAQARKERAPLGGSDEVASARRARVVPSNPHSVEIPVFRFGWRKLSQF